MNATLVVLAFALCAVIVFFVKASASREKRKVYKNNAYTYTAKPLIMTKSEAGFFMTLQGVVSERYYVFPQVHLSALLDYRQKGQDWHYAFRHINGKSVDFVLCDKESLRPVYAIELDDPSHQKKDRKVRDAEVERIFEEADIPLVRFKNAYAREEDIVRALQKANAGRRT